jgi:hypothetical protein
LLTVNVAVYVPPVHATEGALGGCSGLRFTAMHPLTRRGFLAGALGATLASCALHRHEPLVSNHDPVGNFVAPRSVHRYQRLEITGEGLPNVANPFDPAQLEVWGWFRDPHGRLWRVPAFFFQGYERSLVRDRESLTSTDKPTWKVRFAPVVPGTWTWWWSVRDRTGERLGRQHHVAVIDRDAPGFIRRSGRDRRCLVHDDQSAYFAIGENVAWYSEARGTYDYDSWFGRLAEHGANHARLWMPYWAFALEGPDTGVGDYTRRLDRAWQLDYVVELAGRLGLALTLCIQNHGPFSIAFNSEWDRNPYNQRNGGPLARPEAFFTNTEARRLFRQRLRYIVARWAYAPQLLAWELFNEVDLTANYDPAVVAHWHREMSEYLRSLDPHQHLISTSLALYPSVSTSPHDAPIWNTTGLDFTQIHRYTTLGDGIPIGDPDVAHNLGDLVSFMLDTHQQPTLVGEYGINSTNAKITATIDEKGVALHDALWATALSGSFGTAMSWWWDSYIDAQPQRFYPMFGALARFLHGIQWDREALRASLVAASSPSRSVALHGLQGPSTLVLWIKNQNHQWNHPDGSLVSDTTLQLNGLGRDRWAGHWWNTTTGAPTTAVTVVPSGETARIDVPSFSGDIALRLHADA